MTSETYIPEYLEAMPFTRPCVMELNIALVSYAFNRVNIGFWIQEREDTLHRSYTGLVKITKNARNDYTFTAHPKREFFSVRALMIGKFQYVPDEGFLQAKIMPFKGGTHIRLRFPENRLSLT